MNKKLNMKNAINYNPNNNILFLSVFAVFLIGNLLSFDVEVFKDSFKILLFSLFLLILLFAFKKTHETGHVILVGFIVISLIGIFKFDYYRPLFITLSGLFLLRSRPKFDAFTLFKFDVKQFSVGIFIALFAMSMSNYVGFNTIKSIYNGQVDQDTLFHTAIAAMLKTYGVPSIGLDGLVPIKYHIFSHMLYAGVSKISGASVFSVYCCFTKMFLIPLFFWIILDLLTTSKFIEANEVNKFLGIFSSLLILFNFLFKDFGLSFDSIFISESFLISFIILTPFFNLTNSNYKNFFVVIVLVMVLSTTKISVGFIFLASYLVFFYWNSHFEKFGLLKALCAGLVLFGFFFLSINYFFLIRFAQTNTVKIDFCNFTEKYTNLFNSNTGFSNQSLPYSYQIKLYLNPFFYNLYFLSGHFVLAIIFLFIKKITHFSLRKFSHVFIAISLMMSILILSILDIPGGSAAYFSLVPNLFLLIFLCILILKNRSFGNVNLYILCLVSMFLIFPGLTRTTNLGWFKNKGNLDNSLLVDVKLLKELRDLDNLHSVDFRRKSFCSSTNSNLSNYSKLFLFPAISERCWKNILIDSAKNYRNYGFEDYKLNDDIWNHTLP